MGVIDALGAEHVYLDANVFIYALEGIAPDFPKSAEFWRAP